MKLFKNIVIVIVCGVLFSLSSTTFATIGQTIQYNFKAVSEPSVGGWEDVVHPSDDASSSEVEVTTAGWSLVTIPAGWSPFFGVTAFAGNGQQIPDGGAILSPFAEYHLQGKFAYGLPAIPDYTAEFFLTGMYFPSYNTDGNNAFDTGVLNSNRFTQVPFNLYGAPAANMILTGLNPAKVYNFKIAGSLDDTSPGYLIASTVYAVGTTENNVLVNTKGNTSHYATFANVVPNAQGEIELWANAAWNPAGYVGMLGGIQVIESDSTDVPVITFGSDEVRIDPYGSRSTTVSASVVVGGGAAITAYRWKQIKGPAQVTIVSPTSDTTTVNNFDVLGVYEFELSALSDNGIEQRKTMKVIVDSLYWVKKTIPNSNILINDGQDIEYLEYLPDDYSTTGCENKNYPTLVYLHGFGQNGRDTEMLKGEGLGYLVDQGLTNLQFSGVGGEVEKFIGIIPQLSTNTAWTADDIDGIMSYIMSGMQYRADYNRIYIAGFSYGSLGLRNYLGTPNKADQFAASVNSAFVPTTWSSAYCNANGLPIFAMGEADMVYGSYYISSPTDFNNFMANLGGCPLSPVAIGQIMTGRDHTEMYHFYWQLDYTGFEGKNIYDWFLGNERNYASGGAGQGCFSYTPSIDIIISPSIQTVAPSTTAQFTVTVINTGNIDLSGMVISSDTVSDCNITIPYLAQGSSTGYTCVQNNVNVGFTNTMLVTGYAYSGTDMYDGKYTTDMDSAIVNIATFIPALEVFQGPATQNILSGNSATITIKIANSGDVDLSGVVVANPSMPSCDITLGYLAQGTNTGYDCIINNVVSSFTTTTYASGYAYSGGSMLLGYPTAASASSDIVVVGFLPAIPLLDISISPSSQSISAGGTALFTVTVTNTGNTDLTGVMVQNPTIPGCDTVIGYLPIGGVAGYSCQKNNVSSSFITTIFTSGYVYSGGTEYPLSNTTDFTTASINVIPIVVTPPVRSGFGGGGMGTTTQVLSTLPQTQPTTTLSSLPLNPNEPTVIVSYPQGPTYNPPFVGQGGQSVYSSSTNGSAEYKLPYSSLREFLQALIL